MLTPSRIVPRAFAPYSFRRESSACVCPQTPPAPPPPPSPLRPPVPWLPPLRPPVRPSGGVPCSPPRPGGADLGFDALLQRAGTLLTGRGFDPDDPGFPAAAGISASDPASVLVRRRGSHIGVAVADPGRTLTTVSGELPSPTKSVAQKDDTVDVLPGRRTVLTVAVGGSPGHTHRAEPVR
ncbi:polysaccharide lyase beta-sandwich domain-containing protein [Streptomyces sp. NPDC006971]|uniref:polysaccharide lyase beta-sandwich domain-containing protein n=1 Tax=Streptomyces sp. NPDC006971 TaxID=3154784 RepID=UPI0034008B1E